MLKFSILVHNIGKFRPKGGHFFLLVAQVFDEIDVLLQRKYHLCDFA